MKKIIFLLLYCCFIFGQTEFPRDYFGNPLNISLQLSGNFGELRNNHFHTGLDFRTQKITGLPVLASADGYVSRIKISTFGNGKTLYVNHPNGYMTAYAHLEKANGNVETYIKKQHYVQKYFEMDLFLKPNELLVNKGDTIGFSGNSGASAGPHLHFEIRETKTQHIINPLFFGFDEKIIDNIKPFVSKLIVYPIDSATVVNKSSIALPLHISKKKDGDYYAEKVIGNGRIGFGIETADFDNVSGFRHGVYSVETFFNGERYFGYKFDFNSFDEGHFVNALLDFPIYKTTGERIQKLFMNRVYDLSFIEWKTNNGILEIKPNVSGVYRIEVSDFCGNKTTVHIPINYGTEEVTIAEKNLRPKYWIRYGKESILAKDNISVQFEEDTFYDDVYLDFDVIEDTLYLQKNLVPVQKAFIIAIKTENLTKKQLHKMYIATVDKYGNTRYNNTYLKGNTFYTKVKSMEKFCVETDTILPKIVFKEEIEGMILDTENLEIFISDSQSGIKSYNGYLNDRWVLLEYDNKTQKLTHDFGDGIVVDGRNELKVIVEDKVGNTANFATYFYWKQKLE